MLASRKFPYHSEQFFLMLFDGVNLHALYQHQASSGAFQDRRHYDIYTSRTRARRVAEVSMFKKCNAIGSKDKVCL